MELETQKAMIAPGSLLDLLTEEISQISTFLLKDAVYKNREQLDIEYATAAAAGIEYESFAAEACMIYAIAMRLARIRNGK